MKDMTPILFYHHTMEKLAKKVATQCNVRLGRINWEKFSDCWPKIYAEDIEAIKRRPVIYLASFKDPNTVFEQMGVIYALPRYQAGPFRIILPYFPVGTMERVDDDGTIATAMTMMRMLSATPASHIGGIPLLTTFDIHALQERFYPDNCIIPDLRSAIPLLKKEIKSMEDVAIAFPDDGAYKRFGKMFDEYPQIICIKVRDGKERIVKIKEGDPRGKNVITVDDLVMSGETGEKCGIELWQAGAKSVSLWATHGVYPENSWARSSQFTRIIITDSCPWTVEAVQGKAPFVVLGLDPLIVDIIENET
jgi:phosphoribosylpyrophosphate synthetase